MNLAMQRVHVIKTINQKRLAAVLDVSPMTVYLWRRQESDPLPCRSIPTKGGRHRNYFAIQEVQEWLTRNRPQLANALQGGVENDGRHSNAGSNVAARLSA